MVWADTQAHWNSGHWELGTLAHWEQRTCSSLDRGKACPSYEWAGVAKTAVYLYCYGHALNLACVDTIKNSKIPQDSLEVAHEITKLIKYFPKREAVQLSKRYLLTQ